VFLWRWRRCGGIGGGDLHTLILSRFVYKGEIYDVHR
jgi:hypothetical protein